MRRLISLAASAVAAACLLPAGLRAQSSSSSAQKALVYCPVTIDSIGCSNIVAALAARYPKGVDRGYDGASGTVDLKTVNLWQYDVFFVPSLADGANKTPYALLRDATVSERLHDALMGRVAMWSGTPDLGSASSPNRDQKNALITNLATWAAANYATVKGPGLVTFLDQSDVATDRYGWVQGIARVNVVADTATQSYASVSTLTAAAQAILTSGGAQLSFSNMASFGFQLPNGSAGVSLDAIGQTGTNVGGQVVLLTTAGGNTGGAIVKTDRNDYAPGTTVVMTGTGWSAGETVSLTLHEDPLVDPDRTFTTIADANGNINYSGFAPERHNIGVRFILTATGQTSALRAQTTFTDNVLLKTISFWIHAHQDDWQLFMSDRAQASAQTADNIVFVYATAGDNGQAFSDPYYWQTRESAAKLSVDVLLGDGEWSCAKQTVNTHPIERCVKGKSVSYFLRLPDGGLTGTNYNGKTLPGLRDGSAAAIPLSTIETPSTTSYSSWDDFTATIRGIVDLESSRFGATNIEVHGPEYDRAANPEDHPDHLVAADAVKAAAIGRTWSVSYYIDYFIKYLPRNLSVADTTIKANVFGAYDHVMAREGYQALISLPDYQAWLTRTYFRSAETPPVAQVPVPATSLTARSISQSEIDLAWVDNSSFETEFRVERAPDAGGIAGQFATIATVPANTQTYNDTGLPMGTYWYRVMAHNAAGDASAYTNQVSAQTAAAICVTPLVSVTPAGLTVNLGDAASFTAVPTRGTAPFSYRWQKGGADISGATGTNYTIAAVTTADLGSYTAIITNACGTATSNVATLALNKRTPVFSGLTPPLSITYGAANVTVGGTIGAGGQYPTGVVSVTLAGISRDAPINATTGAFAATIATNTLSASATPYAVTYSYAGDATFLAGSDNSSTTVTVGKASQVVAFTSPAPPNATYGGSYTPSATGGGSGNPITFATTTPAVCTLSGANVVFVAPGSCTVTADQAGNTNFDAAIQQRQSFSVGAAAATIAIANPNPTYDGTAKSAAVTVTGVNGAALAPSAYTVTYSQSGTPISAPKNAGSYDVTVVVTDANYTGTRSGTLSIAKAPLQLTADAQNKIYGTADPVLTYRVTLGTLVTGDGLTGVLVRAAGETVAGSPYAITKGTLSAGPNYDLTVVGANLTITRKELVVSTITVSDKTYDGNTTATVTGGTLAGTVNEDNVGVTATAASFADKHVGLQKPVSVTGLALAGNDAGNYSLNATTASTTASIRARSLTISAAGVSRPYDGTVTATVTLSDDRVSGDLLTTAYASASFSNKNVGTGKTITVSGIALQGPDRGDYTFNTSTTATANVTPLLLTVSAEGVDKTYDGTTAASVKLSYTIIPGDALTVGYSASFTDKNVGSAKSVTVSSFTLGGGDAANYSLPTSSVTTTASILARSISVTADAQTKVYGAPDPAFSYSVTAGSLVAGDALTGTLQRAAGEVVGSYAIQQGTLTAGANYHLTFVAGNLTITPAAATITIDPATLSTTYDGTAKAVRLTTSPTGALADVTVTYGGAATAPTNAGRYDVLATIASGNYTATPARATLVIAQATQTVSFSSAAPTTATYGGTYTPAAAGGASGNPVLLGTSTGSVCAISNGVVSFVGVGECIVTADQAGNTNYSAAPQATQHFTVGKATATITISDPAPVYNATPKTALVSVTGASGVTLPASAYTVSYALGGTAVAAPTNAGHYTVSVSVTDPNYTGSQTGTLTIAPAALRVTADAQTKVFGAADPALTYHITSGALVGSDQLSGTLSRAPGETVAGSPYTISQGTLSAGANYLVSFVGSSLTITQATATITLGSLNQTYDGTAKGATANSSPSGLTVKLTYSQNGVAVVSPTNAGSYDVTATILDANYRGSQTGTLVIGTAAQSVAFTTAAPTAATYGGTYTPAATGGASGNPVLFATTTPAVCTISAGVVSFVGLGDCVVTADQAANSNYAAALQQSQRFAVGRATASITITDPAPMYDGTAKAATIAVTGVNGTALSTSAYTVSYTLGGAIVTAPTNAGQYAVTVTVTNPNYVGTQTGTLTITAATAAITLGSLSQVYDGTAKAATASSSPAGLNIVLTYSQNGVSVASPTNAGSYDVAATVQNANYQGSRTGTLVIAKATQTLAFTSIAPSAAGFGSSYTPSATGGASGNAVAFGTTTPAVCTISGGVVSFVGIGDCVVTADQAGNANYAPASQLTQRFTVGKATATITISDPAPVYDGTAKAALVTVTGANGVTLAASSYTVGYTLGGTSVTAPKNAGQYSVAVSVTDPDYTGSRTGTLTINKVQLTVTADAQTKVFGGAEPALTYQVTKGALVAPDQLTGALTRAAGETVAGSPYAISQGTLSAGTNYLLSFVGSSLTITQATATITLGSLNQTYDGTAKGATANSSPSGLTVKLTYSQNGVPIASPTNAGSYDVAAMIDDASYRGTQSGTLVIAKAPQTIAFTTPAPTGAMYGGSYTPAASGGASGNALQFATTTTTVCTISGGVVSFVGLGDCVLTADQAGNANYLPAAQQSQRFAVGRATATITLSDPAPVYDGMAKAAAITVTGVNGAPLAASAYTVSYTLGGTPVSAPKNAGQYTVVVSVTDQNYTGSNSGTLTITAAPLIVTADAQSKVYGAPDPALTYRITSGRLATGDQLSGVLSRAPGDKVAGSPYAILQGSLTAGTNYNLTYVSANLAITRAALIPNVTVADKIYDGAVNAVIVTRSPSGVIANDDVTLTGGNGTFADKNVGSGKSVSVTGLQLSGADAGNYLLAATSATATASIGARALTITATAQSRPYDGTTNATVTLSDDRVQGDALTTRYATATFADANAGTGKTITISGITVTGTDASNYTFNTSTTTTATITKIDQTTTFGALANRSYDDPPFAVTASASSGLPVAFSVGSTDNCTISGSTVTITGAGSCTVTASQAGNNNVNAAPNVSQSFTIAKANQTVTFNQAPAMTVGSPAASIAGSASTNSGLPVTYAGTTPDRCSVTADGMVSVIDVGIGAAGCAITASQAGDANHNAASTSTRIDLLNKLDAIINNPSNTLSWSNTTTYFTVAIMTVKSANGTVLFDASRIDPATVTVTGPHGTTGVMVDSKGQLKVATLDVNLDGAFDMVLYFAKSAVFGSDNVGQTYTVTLNGNLKTVAGDVKRDGRPIRGNDKIQITQ